MNFKKIRNSSFLKNVSKVSGGVILSQIITVIVSPILTRLYSPAQMGIYSGFLSATNFFKPIINGRFDFLIVSKKEKDSSLKMANVSFRIAFIFSALYFIGSIIYSLLKKDINGNTLIYTFGVSLMMMLFGLFNIFNSISTRNKDYKRIGKSYVIRSVVQIALQVIFGVLSFGTSGLIISVIVGLLTTVVVLVGRDKNEINKVFNYKNTKSLQLFKQNYKQLVVGVPSAIINSFVVNALSPLLLFLYSEEITGYYSIAYKVLALPLSIISTSISTVYYERACRERDEKGTAYRSFRNTVLFSSVLFIPVFIIIYFVAKPAIIIVFGKIWEPSGSIIKALIPLFVTRGVAQSIIMTPYVYSKQKADFINQIILGITMLISFVISYYFKVSYEYFFYIFAGFMSLAYIYIIISCYFLAKKKVY